jgi:hypothetical protein
MSDYQIKLRSSELYVLAGALGYNSLIGVEENTLFKWQSELRLKVQKTIRSLEKKKLIQLSLDGVLFIDENLKKAIDILCKAEYIGMFSCNLENNRTQTIYLTFDGAHNLLLEKTKDKYLLTLTDSLDSLDSLFEPFLYSNNNIHEFLLYEDAEYIKNLLFSFDDVGAMDRTKKCVKDESVADVIMNIVSGKSNFLNIQIHKKQGDVFINAYNSFIALTNGNTVELNLDKNRVLFIDTIEAELIKSKVKSILNQDNRGTING